MLTWHTILAIVLSMDVRGANPPHSDRCEPRKPLDWLIAEFARSQHGVVALWQLLAEGVSPSAVQRRVAAGRLHRVHDGVYAVGYARLTKQGRYMAAVLACRPGSGLSHRSATDLRELWRFGRQLVDVISPRRPGRRRAGIDAHTERVAAAVRHRGRRRDPVHDRRADTA